MGSFDVEAGGITACFDGPSKDMTMREREKERESTRVL